MILRRLTRRAAPPRALITCLCAVMTSLQASASAEPLTAADLPPAMLSACDARAENYGRYAPPIAAAAKALIDLGALTSTDFADAKIGFCGLKGAGGPVAATSCDDGVILLDEKYAAGAEALPLRATLAHEMKHHLQHAEKKTRHGEGYCASARYAADKPALEAEADAFGDAVAALFTLGRPVEIVNACDEALLVYLEADAPVAVRGATPAFERIPARGAALAGERGLSRRFRFHAETAPEGDAAKVTLSGSGAQTRIVEGRQVRLRETTLGAPRRIGDPFRLRLRCRRG